MSCNCHACNYSRMLGAPASDLAAIERRLRKKDASPSIHDTKTFEQCYVFIYKFMLQNILLFGGSVLAISLRTMTILCEKHPRAFRMSPAMVRVAERALPLSFAHGMDTEGLCAAWTFVGMMWKQVRSPKLANYLAWAFMHVPMQAITDEHLECVLCQMSSIKSMNWSAPFLERLEELCVIRFRKMDQRNLARAARRVGEVVANTKWTPALLVALLTSGNGLMKVSELSADGVHDAALGMYLMREVVGAWELFKGYSRLEHRLVLLDDEEEKNEEEDKAAASNTRSICQDVMNVFGKSNYTPSRKFADRLVCV